MIIALAAAVVAFLPASPAATAVPVDDPCGPPHVLYDGRTKDGITQATVGDDPDITLGDLVVSGDVVLGPWWYAPAADGTTLRGLDLYTMRDGKIAAKDVFQQEGRRRAQVIIASAAVGAWHSLGSARRARIVDECGGLENR